jgi:hypothetical protein
MGWWFPSPRPLLLGFAINENFIARLNNSPLSVHILSQFNPVYSLPPSYLQMNFNIPLIHAQISLEVSFLLKSEQNVLFISYLPHTCHLPVCTILVDFLIFTINDSDFGIVYCYCYCLRGGIAQGVLHAATIIELFCFLI